jgi:hypothetical protein
MRQDLIAPSKCNGGLLLEAFLTAFPSSTSEGNSSSRSNSSSNNAYGHYYRPYVGNTTHKLVAALKAMLIEQLCNCQDVSDDDDELRVKVHDVFGSIDPVDYQRILMNVCGIMKNGGLWSDDNYDGVYATDQVHSTSLVPYGSPVGRILSLLCFYMSRQSSPRLMMVVWNVFVDEIKIMWEKRIMVSNAGFSLPSDDAMHHGSYYSEGSKHCQQTAQSYYSSRHGTCCGDCRTDVDRESSLLDQKLQVSKQLL